MQSRLQLLRSRKTKLCHVRNRLKCCLRLYLSERNNCWHLFFRRRTSAGKRFAPKGSYSLSTARHRNWYPVSMQDDHQRHAAGQGVHPVCKIHRHAHWFIVRRHGTRPLSAVSGRQRNILRLGTQCKIAAGTTPEQLCDDDDCSGGSRHLHRLG